MGGGTDRGHAHPISGAGTRRCSVSKVNIRGYLHTSLVYADNLRCLVHSSRRPPQPPYTRTPSSIPMLAPNNDTPQDAAGLSQPSYTPFTVPCIDYGLDEPVSCSIQPKQGGHVRFEQEPSSHRDGTTWTSSDVRAPSWNRASTSTCASGTTCVGSDVDDDTCKV